MPSEPGGERQCGRGTMGLQVRREAAWCLGRPHVQAGVAGAEGSNERTGDERESQQRLRLETHS